MKKVLVAGTCNEDLIDGNSYLGGSTAGIAINLSLLGISAGVVSIVGNDTPGNLFVDEFKQRNIDISLLKTDARKTPQFVLNTKIDSDLGHYHDYGIDEMLKSYSPDSAKLNTFDILHASNIAKEFGDYLATNFRGDISYSPNRKFVRDHTYISLQMVGKARYIFCNEEEFEVFEKVVNVKTLFSGNLEMVCVTKGKDDLLMLTKNGKQMFPIHPIKKLVDPTGAGDAVVTGFLAEIAKGSTLAKGLQTGLKLASVIVQQKGIILPDSVETAP